MALIPMGQLPTKRLKDIAAKASPIIADLLLLYDSATDLEKSVTMDNLATAILRTSTLGQKVNTAHGKTLLTTVGPGNYTVPTGVYGIWVTPVGGGGGGGGSTVGSGSGGEGGEGSFLDPTLRSFLAVTPGQIISFNIGDGGNGGVGASNGSAGGTTSFTGVPSATGGRGGRANYSGNTRYKTATGSPGMPSGSSAGAQAGWGHGQYLGGNGGAGNGTGGGAGGGGGAGWGGDGGVGADSPTLGANNGGIGTNGGGGGGGSATSSSNATGGKGGPGCIVIDY